MSLSIPQRCLKSDALESADQPMTLPVGSRLGPYEILAAIGAGGMGEVYRAKDTRLHRVVAIKVLPEALARRPGSWPASSARPGRRRR